MATVGGPFSGRNFECFSEDPYLSARLAVAYITGVQSEGIGASVKHCICNDEEFERYIISSEVHECALREIYLLLDARRIELLALLTP
jgi:beta-glucosidase